MRLILASILFNFDMKLAEESTGWLNNQLVHFLWVKPPLKVHMTPVKR